MANKSGSKLFVSIHRNKADGDGQGVEGFIPQTDDEGSRFLGESIMHALVRAGFTERTIRAGTLNSSSDDYEENASTNMPSVLIEVGFLSSDYDNRLFDSNLNGNAKAIASAIDVTYMKLYEPEKYAEYERELTTASNIAKRSLKKIRKVMRITSKAVSHEE
jgi:N-acetylmuramoyl-L-alanine amidase